MSVSVYFWYPGLEIKINRKITRFSYQLALIYFWDVSGNTDTFTIIIIIIISKIIIIKKNNIIIFDYNTIPSFP